MMSPSTTASERGSTGGGQTQGNSSFVSKYCRMCALELKQGVFIFGEEGKRLQIAEKIRKTVSILVLEEDSLPKKICMECCSSLEDFSHYKDTVLDAQEKLTSIARNLERSQEQNLLHLQVQQQQQLQVVKFRKAVVIAPQKPLPASPSPPQSPSVAEPVEDPFQSRELEDHNNNDYGEDNIEKSPAPVENEPEGVSPPKAPKLCFENKAMTKEYSTSRIEPASPVASSSGNATNLSRIKLTENTWNLICGLCGMMMEGRDQLETHHKNKHDTVKHLAPVFGCPVCPRVTENYTALRMHIYRHRKEGSFECLECEKTFPVKDQLDRHMIAAHDPAGKAFSCKICAKRFSAKCSLAFHITSKHPTDPQASRETGQDLTPSGGKEQSHSEQFDDEHDPRNNFTGRIDEPIVGTIEQHSSETSHNLKSSESHPSSISPKDSVKTLRNYEAQTQPPEHPSSSTISSSVSNGETVQDKGTWRCEYCDKIFQTEPGYRAHVATHKGKRFVCDQCGAIFTQKGSLTHHISSMHNESPKEFCCEICFKDFATLKLLKLHKQFHVDDSNPVKCKICQKEYRSEVHLKSHMKTHSQTKNFMCATCGKTFRNQAKLNNHENIHSGAKPYECMHCDFATASSGPYYKHLKKHQEAKGDNLNKQQNKPSSSTVASDEKAKEPESRATVLSEANPVTVNMLADLRTKSPQKSSPVPLSSSQSINVSSTNASVSSSTTHQNSMQHQPSPPFMTQPTSVQGAVNNNNAHHTSQFSVIEASHFQSHPPSSAQGHDYTLQQQAHQVSVWGPQPTPNSSSQIGRSYQNPTNSSTESEVAVSHSSTTGMQVDLVNCTIQHALISEDLSSPSQQLQASHSHLHHHTHNYTPTSNHNSSASHPSVVHSSNHSHHNIVNNVSQHSSFAPPTSLPISTSVNNNSSTVTNLSGITSTNASHSHHTINSQPHQSEPIELSYKLHIDNSGFQVMPMELTTEFQRDPLELCVRQEFNPLMDLSSRVPDPSGVAMNSINLNSISVNGSSGVNGGGGGMSAMNMVSYPKLDLAERELMFNDLSGPFRQPIDLISRESSHELCSEGNLVDLSLRPNVIQEQSASSFLRDLIDLSSRSDSFHGELNLTNKHHHHQGSGSNSHSVHSNQHGQHHYGNSSNCSTSSGAHRHSTGGNGSHHNHNNHHGNGPGSFHNVIYQDMFHLQN